MAVSVEGVFRIIDRASGPMARMEAQARKTDRAIDDLGDRLDTVGTSQHQRHIQDTERSLRNLDRTSVDVSRSSRNLGVEFERTDRKVQGFGGSIRKSGMNLIAFGAILRTLKLPLMFAGISAAVGVAAQAIGALGGGIISLIPKLADLTGALAPAIAGIVGMGLAMATVKLAFKDFSQAMGGNAEALAKLTPQAKEFLITLKQWEPVIKRLRATAQGGLFGGLDDALKSAQRAIPVIDRLIGRMSGALGGLARQGARRFTTRGFLEDFENIGNQGVRAVTRLGEVALNVADAFRHIAIAAEPLTDWLGKLLVRWSELLLNWAKTGRESGRLSLSFQRTRQSLKLFVDILGNLWDWLTAIGRAARPLGDRLWNTFRRATESWAEFANSFEGRVSLTKQFMAMGDAIIEIGGLVEDLVKALFRMGSDQGLAGIVARMREWVPILERALTLAVQTFGPALLDLLEAVIKLLESLIREGGPFMVFLDMLTRIVEGVTWLLDHVPGLGGVIAAAFSVYAILKFAGVLAGVVRSMAILAGLQAATSLGGGGGKGPKTVPILTPKLGKLLRFGARYPGPLAAVGAAASYFAFPEGSGVNAEERAAATTDWEKRTQAQATVAGQTGGGGMLGRARRELGYLQGVRAKPFWETGSEEAMKWMDQEIAARKEIVAQLEAEKQAREVTRAPNVAARLIEAAQTGLRRGQPLGSLRGWRGAGAPTGGPGVLGTMGTQFHEQIGKYDTPAGQRRFAQTYLNQLKEAFGGASPIVQQMRGRVMQELQKLQGGTVEINGRIYRNFRTAWRRIWIGILDEARAAQVQGKGVFSQIQRDAVNALQGMGYTPSQASKLVIAATQAGGGPAGVEAMNRVESGFAVTEGGGGSGSMHALGGRIVGRGLRDTIPLAAGHIGAPGELITNRHTERRVDRMLALFGTSLDREVSREGRPHYMALGGRIAGGGPSVTGDTDYKPALGAALTAMARGTGHSIYVTSGGRTLSEQAALKAQKGDWAASPTPNAPHVRGIAADISPGAEVFGGVASRYGLGFPLWHHPSTPEPWHIELGDGGVGTVGATGNATMAAFGGVTAPRVRARGIPGLMGQHSANMYAAALSASINGLVGGGGVVGGGGGTSGANQALGKRMMLAMGFGAGEWGSLQSLWQGESGWSTTADNPSSSAYGIPQALPGSKMASAGADWATNPATQIRWGLNYIRSRYGSPSAAYSAWSGRSPHWYATGGRLPGGSGGGGGVRRPVIRGMGGGGGGGRRGGGHVFAPRVTLNYSGSGDSASVQAAVQRGISAAFEEFTRELSLQGAGSEDGDTA